MRIWDRLKLFVPALMAILLMAEASAQQMMGGPPAMMAGPIYQSAYQGIPQPYQASPTISPFQNAFEQTYNDDGLWFRKTIGAISIERLLVDMLKSDTL